MPLQHYDNSILWCRYFPSLQIDSPQQFRAQDQFYWPVILQTFELPIPRKGPTSMVVYLGEVSLACCAHLRIVL